MIGWIIFVGVILFIMWCLMRINYVPDNKKVTLEDCLMLDKDYGIKTEISNGMVTGFLMEKGGGVE